MSIRISSRKTSSSAPIIIKPSRPKYTSDDEDRDVNTKSSNDTGDETLSSWKQAESKKDDDYEEDYDERNNNKTTDYSNEPERDDSNRDFDKDEVYQNGDTEVDRSAESDKKSPPAAPPKPAPKMTIAPTKVAPALLHKREKQWPPPAPKMYDAFAVEGHGRMNPYTKEFIKDEEEKEEEEEDKRLEIDEGHTAPVKHLRKNWQGRKDGPMLGVQRPAATIKGETAWIKHVKPEIEYEEPPKEPEWLQLVRNRRWNSTVKARFPCKTDDIVEFERRSTTPKNWKRLLLDKKAVRTIGQITGIGAEGEELLWRLAKQRGKIEETKEIPIPGEKDILAYEYVKGNLEAAVAEAAIQALEGSEAGDAESLLDEPVKPTSRDRKPSSTSSHPVSAATIRQRLLRLHPEEFKKLLALDRARDAHLRWQFSTDPYDSVHEHQLQPFEIALLAGERENRLRYLLKKLLRAEDMPMSSHSSGTSTPVFGKPRGRSLPGSSYTSDQESDSGSSVSSQRKSRAKKKPPVPLPRKGRSVSPAAKDENKEVLHGFLGPEEEQITSELKRLEEMAKGIGLPKEISDLLKESVGKQPKSRERPEDSISMGLGDRMRNFATDPKTNKVVSSASEKEVPSNEIKRSLEDRKLSFFGQAEKAKSYKKEESELDDTDGGKASEIDMEEISSRRKKFLNQERDAQNVSKVPEKSKARHKVQRIKSDAELYAVLSKRRMATDDEDTATEEPSSEMKGIIDDITNTFGSGEKQSSKGRRKPRYQSSEDSEANVIEEKEEKDEEDDDVDDEDESPRRRSRRVAKADNGRQARQRARKWSESENSEEEEDGR